MSSDKNDKVSINMDEIDRMISDSIHDVGDDNRKRTSQDKISNDVHDNEDEDANKRMKLNSDKDKQEYRHENDNSGDNENLDLQFEMAIEKHHPELSHPPEEQIANDKIDELQNQGSTSNINEDKPEEFRNQESRDSGDQNEGHTDINDNRGHDHHEQPERVDTTTQQPNENESENKDDDRNPQHIHNESEDYDEQSLHNKVGTVLHQGITVPANSELLNTNSAFSAYNEISNQLPQVSAMSNIHLSALPLPIIAADYLPPRVQLLVNSLPTLDNLSTQLLRIFTVEPYQRIIDLVSAPDTPQGAIFRDLTSLFEITKKLYSEDEPFLSVEHLAPGIWKEGDKTPNVLKNREQSIESTLRKVNLSTFLLATLGVIEVGFFFLNESFLSIFCPLNNLDPDNSLSNMNGNNLSLQSNGNTTVGGDKIGKLLKPQSILYLDLKTQAYISAIEAGERSREEILNDIFPDNLSEILMIKRATKLLNPIENDFLERCKSRKLILLNYNDDSDLSEEYEWVEFLKNLFEFINKNITFLIWGRKAKPSKESGSEIPAPDANHNNNNNNNNNTDNTNNNIRTENEVSNNLLPSDIREQQLQISNPTPSGNRLSNRRPWTKEEEKALRHALELKGPHWSSILESFGAGGKISEALKNRNAVQLKDKARNWKMFFLKSGLPVPDYLTKVTGDLERDDKLKRARKNAAAPIPKVK